MHKLVNEYRNFGRQACSASLGAFDDPGNHVGMLLLAFRAFAGSLYRKLHQSWST